MALPIDSDLAKLSKKCASPPTISILAFCSATAKTSAFSLAISLPASIDAMASCSAVSSPIRNSSCSRASLVMLPMALNFSTRPSASAWKCARVTSAFASPTSRSALASDSPRAAITCAFAIPISRSALALDSPRAAIISASAIPFSRSDCASACPVALMILALAMPSFSKDTDLAS